MLAIMAPCCANAQRVDVYKAFPTGTVKAETYSRQLNGNYDILQNNQYNQQIKVGEVRQTLNNNLDVFSGSNSYNLQQTHTISPNLSGGYDVYKYNSYQLPSFEYTIHKPIEVPVTTPLPKIDYNRNALKMLRLDK